MNALKVLVSVTAGVLMASGASAAITTLTDRNSVVRLDDSSQAGFFDWEVDGVDQLFQQWFWFRVGGAGQESSLDTLPLTGYAAVDTNPFDDPGIDSVSLQYTGASIRVTGTWTLRGGDNGSGLSDLSESLSLTNMTGAPISVTFFQYTDFDLGNTVIDQYAQVVGVTNNTIQQQDIGFTFSETIITPSPDNFEVSVFPVLLNSLNDGAVTSLSGAAGPIGPGDLVWAVSWTVALGPNQTINVVKDKSIVPTPGAVALIGVAGLAGLRRRR